MSDSLFLILPCQLFVNWGHLKQFDNIAIIEEPMFFYDAVHRPFRTHTAERNVIGTPPLLQEWIILIFANKYGSTRTVYQA